MRKIKVVSTLGISGVIETNVNTLGELKPLLNQRGIQYQGVKMMIGETKNELSDDQAILPTSDFKLYLVPSKTKSGSIESDLREVLDELSEIRDMVTSIYDRDCTCQAQNTQSGAHLAHTPAMPSVSYEDKEDMEEVRRLANQSIDPWG